MAVGSTEELRVATSVVQMRPGDFVLLCSDGLHGIVGEKFLSEALDSEKTLAEKCHYLVEAAKNEGGPDNVTVVLIKLA
jgi:protein phosphatase